MSSDARDKPAQMKQVSMFKLDSPYLKYERDVTSQTGEDGIIEKIIEVIKPERKFCVEFGAWDGKPLSNCYDLVKNKGWSGLFLEGDADRFQELEGQYADREDVQTVNRFVHFEGPDILDNILEQSLVPHDFGLLSIDIDGNDYHVWEGLKNFRPEIVVIEINPTIPNDIIFVQAKSFEVNQGNSLLAMILLGKEKGYELACCTTLNAIFVVKEKYETLNIKNNDINTLYKPHWDGPIFQGMDSTIFVVGMDTMIWWDGRAIDHEDLQLLPKSLRLYSDSR